uniref:ABC transmembrane type-1 domain-containing protein n=1 Tax=Romanomermis culicivorax TaxID=13658 RepID=A0A915JWA9_ROMCU
MIDVTLLQRFYISTSRQLKRLESATRSPIFAHFQETLTGLVCVRAFGVEKNFVDEAKRRLDQNQACLYPNVVAN